MFYLDDGIVQAAFAIDRGDDIVWAKELIAARAAPDPDKLRDQDIELEELLPLT
jgi:3-phenylpropionate/trans-cinnamate dioxygenase ferredoxin reductase subunit